ncbi:MAG: three-Cys-motif partner protein TcmP [Methylococcaceae bacterium]
MSKKEYHWDYDNPDIIETHSVSKLEVISYYLEKYIQTLSSSPQQDMLNLTLVDGFCGGGVYLDSETKKRVYGSPVIIHQAVERAEDIINNNKSKPFKVKADYFFIDKEPEAINCLNKVLADHDYKNSSHVYLDEFENKIDDIITFIKKKGRAHRSIFILDQYGYSDISISVIRKILENLNGSEIIITLNVDSFSRFATDKEDISKRLLERHDLPLILKDRTIEDIKSNNADWNLFIQTAFCQELVRTTKVPFYTPFFIRSGKGQGNYWLLHFSKHYRARDVMATVHWEKTNSFINYAGAGLDMFNVAGFETKNAFGQGLLFDKQNRQLSIETMHEQLADRIYCNDEGLRLETLFATTCNESPATLDIYKETLFRLLQEKDIDIITESGGTRKVANTISVGDIIKPSLNYQLFR